MQKVFHATQASDVATAIDYAALENPPVLGHAAVPFAEPRADDRPVVRIHLLGTMRATTCLGHNVMPSGKRARAVLGYLCLAPGAEAGRAQLAAVLWDSAATGPARTNLRQALHELSLAFGAFAPELIISSRDNVRLNVGACWIDALAAMSCDVDAADDTVGGLLALCTGDLLEGLDGTSRAFDEWLLRERIRIAERQQLLLERALGRVAPKTEAFRTLARSLANVRDRATALAGYRRRTDAWNVATSHSRDRLRVGVLPFVAGSEKEDNLAFSLSQEVAGALSRFRWFDVIAPFAMRCPLSDGFAGDPNRRQGHDLDYVVDGVTSGNGNHLHINVRLLDLVEQARQVWCERFTLARNELHRLNELVTTRIVARVDPVILQIEGEPKRREKYGATGLILLAMPLIFSMERRKYEEAGRLIERALEMDPDNPMVEAWAAYWHLFYSGQGWTANPRRTFDAVQMHARRAIDLDPDNAEALGIYAHACAYANRDFDTAVRCFDRSLRLNPSLAFIWGLSSMTYCYIGEPDAGLARLERYRALAPFDPHYCWFENFYTVAYCFKGDYERSVIFGRRATKATPDFVAGYKPLIASLGHLGRRDEAAPYIAKLLELEPDFSVARFGRVYPFKRTGDRRRYMRGLALAGVPER